MSQKYLIALLLTLMMVFLAASVLAGIVGQARQARETGRLAKTIKDELVPVSQISRNLAATLDDLQRNFQDAVVFSDAEFLQEAAWTRDAFLEFASSEALASRGHAEGLRSLFEAYYETAYEVTHRLVETGELPPSAGELTRQQQALRERLDRIEAHEARELERALAALARPTFPKELLLSLVAAAGAAACGVLAIGLVAFLDTSGRQTAQS